MVTDGEAVGVFLGGGTKIQETVESGGAGEIRNKVNNSDRA